MDAEEQRLQEEIEKLSQEIEDFKKEKERVRTIVGSIGGVPVLQKKIFEILFIVLVLGSFVLSLFLGETYKLTLMDIAILLVSLKLIYMLRNQARVGHFQLWVLSSIEWRINEVAKKIQKHDPKKDTAD